MQRLIELAVLCIDGLIVRVDMLVAMPNLLLQRVKESAARAAALAITRHGGRWTREGESGRVEERVEDRDREGGWNEVVCVASALLSLACCLLHTGARHCDTRLQVKE